MMMHECMNLLLGIAINFLCISFRAETKNQELVLLFDDVVLHKKTHLKKCYLYLQYFKDDNFCTSAVSSMGRGSIGMTSPLFIVFRLGLCSAKRERKIYLSPSSWYGERGTG